MQEFEEPTPVVKGKKGVNPYLSLIVKGILFLAVGLLSTHYRDFVAFIAIMALAVILIFSFFELLYQYYQALFKKDPEQEESKLLNIKLLQFLLFLISYLIFQNQL